MSLHEEVREGSLFYRIRNLSTGGEAEAATMDTARKLARAMVSQRRFECLVARN